MTDPLDRIAAALDRLAPPARDGRRSTGAPRLRLARRRADGGAPFRSAAARDAPRHRPAKGRAHRQSRAPRRRPCGAGRAVMGRARHRQIGVGQERDRRGAGGRRRHRADRTDRRAARYPAGAVRCDRAGQAGVRVVHRRSRLRRSRRRARAALDASGRRGGAADECAAARHRQSPPPRAARHRRAGKRDQSARRGRRSPRSGRPVRVEPGLSMLSIRTAIWRSCAAMPKRMASSFDPHDAIGWATRRGSRSGRVAWHYIVDLAGRSGKAL